MVAFTLVLYRRCCELCCRLHRIEPNNQRTYFMNSIFFSVTSTKRILAAIAMFSAFGEFAQAYELITNGDFEGGSLADWTLSSTGFGNFNVIPNGSNSALSAHPTARLSTGGSFVALSDQFGPGGEELRQRFTVPVTITSLILSFDWFNNTHAPYTGRAGVINGLEQHGRVDILADGAPALDVGSGVVQNLIFDAGTFTMHVTDTIPWIHQVFDLSRLIPGNYELRFGNGECCYYQEMGVDNVSLTAIAEPGSIVLLGLGLIGISIYHSQNKSKASSSMVGRWVKIALLGG